MASYTRQSTFSDGDLITAALFNDEYNQLLAAFDNATGHKHDGTVGEGPVISIIGDAGLATPLNKILIDTTNDHIEFWIDVSGTSTQQLYIADGAIVPVTDNDIDLGTNSLQFKDLYINGTANIDNLAADSVDINGGNIDGTVIGATTAAAGTFTTIDASSNVVISGNLTVSGTTTSVNSNEVNIGDNIIVLNSDETGTPSQNAGIEIERGTSTNVSLLWNESNDYWTFGSDDLNFPDSSKAKFGTGNDLEIYHDGSNSYVADRGTGNLRLEGTNIALNNQTSSKTYLLATDGGSVQLRHNDATKFETTSTGIDVTGTVTSDGVVSDGNVVIDGLLQFEDSGGSNRTVIEYDSNDDVLIKTGTSSGSRSIRFQTEASEVMRIDANARVGIGTASPNYLLDLESTGSTLLRLNSTSGESVLQISVPDTTSFADINFGDSGSTTSGQIRYRHNGDSMAFSTGGTERARIDSNGNLLIGTTAADIVGSSTATGINLNPNSASSFNRSGGAPLFVNRIGSDGTLLQFRKSGVTVGEIGTNSGYVRIGTGDTHLLYHSGIDTIIPYSGSANRDNAISLGYSGARFKDLHLSGTANFGSLSDGTITITGFVDEDNMSSNSATLVPTQQSVKAYVDSQISSAGGNGISFEDNEKAQFGDGNDLQIYHDGSNSYIADTGTGALNIKASNNLRLQSAGSENYLTATNNGAVAIFYDNSVKLATTSTGIDVTGTVTSDGLTVEGDATIKGGSDVSNTGATLQLESTETQAVGSGASISFKGDDGSGTQRTFGVIKGSKTSATSGNFNGGLDFFTRVTAEANARKRLAIASNGDIAFYEDTGTSQALFWDSSAESLGIGTTSPDSNTKLHIQGTDGASGSSSNVAANELFIDNNGNTGVTVGTSNTGTGYYAFADSDVALRGGIFYDHSADDMGFRVASATAMTIDSSRNVGIGDSSPDAKLTVQGDVLARDEFRGEVVSYANNQDAPYLIASTSGYTGATTNWNTYGFQHRIKTDSGGVPRITIDTHSGEVFAVTNNNRVGIGISAATSPLHVYNATVDTVANFESGDASVAVNFTASDNSMQITTSGTDGIIKNNGAGNFRLFNNGSERARIDSSGRLLIGQTSSNGDKLEIQGDANVYAARLNGSTTGGQSYGLRVRAGSNSSDAGLLVENTSGTDLFKVRGDGNVGIGTTSPSYALTVVDSGNVASFGDGTRAFRVYTDADEVSLLADGSVPMKFYTSGSEKARIDSSGNVGIGTTSPVSRLTVDGATTGFAASGITLKRTGSLTGSSDIILAGNSGTEALSFRVNQSEKFRVAHDGNVGIGTASPAQLLHLSSSNPTIQFTDTDTGADSYIRANTSTGALKIEADENNEVANSAIQFDIDGSEKARIDSSGNVLVGKTSTSYAVEGIALRTDNNGVMSTVTNNFSFVANRLSSDGTLMLFAKDTSTVGRISTTGGDLLIGTGDCGIRFSDGGDQIRVCTDTGTNRDGAIDLGYSDSRFKDLYLSGTANVGSISANSGTTNTVATFTSTDSGAGINLTDNSGTSTLQQTTDTLRIGVDEDGAVANSVIAFRVDGSEKARIDSSGRLGIGTTAPSTPLSVHSALTSGQAIAEFRSTGNSNATIDLRADGTGDTRIWFDLNGATPFAIGVDNSDSDKFKISGGPILGTNDRFVIDSSGNIGIGTSSPDAPLTVHNSSDPEIRFGYSSTQDHRIAWDSSKVFIHADPENANGSSALGFSVDGTERARIDSSGNLLVGKTSTGISTDGIELGTRVESTADGTYPLRLNRRSSDGEIINFRKNGSTVGSIGIQSSGFYIDGEPSHSGLRFTSAGITPRLNHTESDNTVNLGESGIRFKDLHLSGTANGNKIHLVNNATDDTVLLESTEDSSSAAPVLTFKRNSGSVADADYLGQLKFKGENDADQEVVYAKITAKIQDASDGTEDGLLEFANKKAGSNVITARLTSDTLKLLNSTSLEVDGSVGIGTTSVDAPLHVETAKTSATSPILKLKDTSATDVMGEFISFHYDGTSAEVNCGRIGAIEPIDNAPAMFIANGGIGLKFFSYTLTDEIVPCDNAGADKDDVIDLGKSAARFDNIYATNGTIQTSDRNEKQDIQTLTDAEQRVATACKGLIRRYKFNRAVTEKGDNARYHFGIIAQDLQDAFTAEGLDAGDYGMFISETWEDSEGVEHTRLGVRYHELLAFIIATL